MNLNDSLADNIQYLKDVLASEAYDIEGLSISLLVRDRDTNETGYLINYEAHEFLKLIAVLEIAKQKIIQDNQLCHNPSINKAVEDE